MSERLKILDSLASCLNAMSSFNLITAEQIDKLYANFDNFDEIQLNSLDAIIEMTTRLIRIFEAYNVYSSYPDTIIENIDESSIHAVLNVKDYLLQKADKLEINLNTETFDKLYSKLNTFAKSSLLYGFLVQAHDIISGINVNNFQEATGKLSALANIIKLKKINVVLERRLLSGINQIRIQLENIKVPTYDGFATFIENEIKPAFQVLLARLDLK